MVFIRVGATTPLKVRFDVPNDTTRIALLIHDAILVPC